MQIDGEHANKIYANMQKHRKALGSGTLALVDSFSLYWGSSNFYLDKTFKGQNFVPSQYFDSILYVIHGIFK